MSKQYVIDFLVDFEFPDGAQAALAAAYDKLTATGMEAPLRRTVEKYEKKILSYNECIEQVKLIAIRGGLHEYTLTLIFLILLGRVLKREYGDRGIEERLWRESMLDLSYKAQDCHALFGVWGTKDAPWHKRFFNLTRFGFGKLQFDAGVFGGEYESEGLSLRADTPVLNVHIPRTGGKLDYDGVRAAYADATAFFRGFMPEKYEGRTVVFALKSWMLFERHGEFLPPTSNFMKFCSDFEIVETGTYPDYASAHWVFRRLYDGDLSALPADSSLQRAYIGMIRRGEPLGWGRGIFCPEWNGLDRKI